MFGSRMDSRNVRRGDDLLKNENEISFRPLPVEAAAKLFRSRLRPGFDNWISTWLFERGLKNISGYLCARWHPRDSARTRPCSHHFSRAAALIKSSLVHACSPRVAYLNATFRSGSRCHEIPFPASARTSLPSDNFAPDPSVPFYLFTSGLPCSEVFRLIFRFSGVDARG